MGQDMRPPAQPIDLRNVSMERHVVSVYILVAILVVQIVVTLDFKAGF